MKVILVLACLVFVDQAFGSDFENAYRCEDGGVLEIGVRNGDGYAQASLTFEDERSSDLAAIWFTSNPQSLVGTMLSDEGDDLGPVVLNADSSTLELGYEKIKCTSVNSLSADVLGKSLRCTGEQTVVVINAERSEITVQHELEFPDGLRFPIIANNPADDEFSRYIAGSGSDGAIVTFSKNGNVLEMPNHQNLEVQLDCKPVQ